MIPGSNWGSIIPIGKLPFSLNASDSQGLLNIPINTESHYNDLIMSSGEIEEAYISVDVETAGPYPGLYSLLSIGACSVWKPEHNFYMLHLLLYLLSR